MRATSRKDHQVSRGLAPFSPVLPIETTRTYSVGGERDGQYSMAAASGSDAGSSRMFGAPPC